MRLLIFLPAILIPACASSSPAFCIMYSAYKLNKQGDNIQTPWTAARQACLSITSSRSLLKFMSIETMKSSNHLILCRPLLLPSIFPSTRVFSNESALRIRWPKYWSFNFSISPSNEHSGLISFRVDWFNFLQSKGISSVLQYHNSKTSVLQCLSFFMAVRVEP